MYTDRKRQARLDKQWDLQHHCLSQKAKRVVSHILDYPHYPLHELVNKFDLNWEIVKEFKNGISKIRFSVGNVIAFEKHLPTNEWAA